MILDKFFEILPPPRILDIPNFSMSVSDKSIHAVFFSKKNGNLELTKYKEYSIPEGLIYDGQIENIEEFSKILTKIKSDFGVNYARISISEEKAYLFKTKIPKVKRKEVCDAIEFTLEENVPLPASELVFDYVVVGQLNDDLDVVVIALPSKTVDAYMNATEMSGIELLSLEIESQAIVQSVVPRNNISDNMVVYFNGEKMSTYLVSGTVVHFTSTTSIKGDIKDNIPFISQELKKISAYWKSIDNDLKTKNISEIIICGDFVEEDVISQISVNVKIPISLADVWSNIYNLDKFIPNINFKDSLRFAPAIGMAIPKNILI